MPVLVRALRQTIHYNVQASQQKLGMCDEQQKGWTLIHKYLALPGNLIATILALPDSKHLGTTHGTHALSCWLPILHSYGFGVLHFLFGTTLHTVCLHFCLPFCMEDRPFAPLVPIANQGVQAN